MKNIRNNRIIREIVKAKFKNEFTEKYFFKVLDDLDVDLEHFNKLCYKFRPRHLCKKINNQWKQRNNITQKVVDDS